MRLPATHHEIPAPAQADGDDTLRFQAHQLRALGLRTRVFDTGPADATEAVVCVHGGPGSAADWAQLLPELGSNCRAIAFDLPGFGEADKPASWDYDAGGWAMFIGTLLERMGITRAHLILSDLGGQSGLAWAHANPRACASVVLIDTGVLIDYRWHAIARLHRTPFIGSVAAATGRLGIRTAMRIYEPHLPSQVVSRWHRDYERATRRAVRQFHRNTPAAELGALSAGLRALDLPALVLWGEEDRFVPVIQAKRQRESFPSAQVIVLDGVGHFPHLGAPERVAEAVIPFLTAQLTGVTTAARSAVRRSAGVRSLPP
jgi:pimeloyl-ACP methyl ester carboxylesterase